MEWKDVGEFLKNNVGTGAALVGSLITGNIPGAVAAGVAMARSATGGNTADEVLRQFQTDPATLVRLKELAFQNEASIREHLRAMTELELTDAQKEQEQTQLTVRAGDAAEDRFVRWTRPGQSWLSLGAAIVYVYLKDQPSTEVLLLLLTLPWSYAGLRQIGKGVDALAAFKTAKAAK